MLGRKKKPEKPKIGRPVEYGERFPLGLRVTKEVKKKLRDASAVSGRSQSQEAELRLEQTFNATNVLYDALDLAYGRHLTGLLLAMAQAAQITGTRAMSVNEWNFEGCEDWVRDPYSYDQAVKTINALLEAFRPKGKIEIAPVGDFARYPSSTFEDLGKGYALDLLARLAKPDDQRADSEIIRAIAKRIGELLPRK